MCEFLDGVVKEYLANIIVSKILAEADLNGNSAGMLLYKNIDHKLAVKMCDCDKYIRS
jgi:hypothetical protein